MKYEPLFQQLLSDPTTQIEIRCTSPASGSARSTLSTSLQKCLQFHNQLLRFQSLPVLSWRIHVTTTESGNIIISTSENPAARAKANLQFEVVGLHTPQQPTPTPDADPNSEGETNEQQ